MASGASGRGNSGPKGYDFGSDDILGSYNDYDIQDSSNGSHSEPAIGSSGSGKDMHKSRVTRSSVLPSSAYSQPEDSFSQDMAATVERTMKKYADNLMRYLEGISSRLSQLELHCYNLDKSIVEMRSESSRGHKETDAKLKFVEKHIQEVHRSVQIIRDKQELADTQKELAKLQVVRKGSSSSSHSQSNEDRASPSASDLRRTDNISDMPSQQLALALPHQLTLHQQPAALPSQAPPQNFSQQQSYYVPTNQVTNQQGPPPGPPAIPAQHTQSQYLQSDAQYRMPQTQELSRMAPQQPASQVNQAPPSQSFSQYQQQWAQQIPQQVPSQQQSQLRAPSSAVYPSYSPPQSTNASQQEALPNSVPTQVPYSGSPQPVSSRVDTIPYGYAAAGRTSPQQPPPQQIKGTYAAQPGDSFPSPGSHPSLPPGSAYMVYDSEGGRAHHHHPSQQPHFAQGGYPPHNIPPQNQLPSTGTSLMVRNPSHPQFIRNHPYGELIEKLMSMGFRGDHAASVIQRMEESGQQVDFNSVLDRLNAHPSRGGW